MHLVRYRNRSGSPEIAVSSDVAQPLCAGGQALSGFADLLGLSRLLLAVIEIRARDDDLDHLTADPS